MPLLAHNPSDTTIASGVAKPKLQGHATTNMVTNLIKASEKSYPIIKYTINVRIAKTITVGTKYSETLSAILAIGAFVLLASTTNLTISDIVDSFPILSALYSTYPS